MKPEEFCYWLQGYFEIGGNDMGIALTGSQVDTIRRHLSLVFLHSIDPKAGDAAHQQKLNEAHSPPEKPVQASPFTPQLGVPGRPLNSDEVKYRC